MAGNSEESGDIVSKPRVSVRTLSGRTHHFDVQESTTVGGLKQMILRELDIPVEIQRLLFQGRILTDTQLLKEANCFNKVVHLVKRAQPPSTATPSSSRHTTTTTTTTTTTSTPPPNPATPSPASGVMFGSIPPSLLGATQQMFNDVWQSMNYSTPAAAPAASPQPAAQEANSSGNRTLTAMLTHTRQLLLHCQKILDRFERGESISSQDIPRPSLPSSGPSAPMGASLLGDLYLQLGTIYGRMQPLLREQANFMSGGHVLGEGERNRVERLFSCLKEVLEPLHVCERNLASFSVSGSQAPPRTVQLAARISRPHHMSHVQFNINQMSVTRPSAPSTTPGSNPSQQPPPPPLPQIPSDIANIVSHTINSMLPEGSAPVDISTQDANPFGFTGEVFTQNIVNNVPVSSSADLIPSLLQAGLPMDFTILQLMRMFHPNLDQESEGDLSSQLMLLIGGCLTVSQVRDIGQGRVECLQAMYPRLREFVLTKLLVDEGDRGVEGRDRAVRRLAVAMGDDVLDGLVVAIPPQEGLNVLETLIKFLSLNFKTAIAIILDPRNEDPASSQVENRFGKVIWGWGHSMICELLQLMNVMAHNGSTDVHAVMENYIRNFDSTQTEYVLMMLRDNREKIDTIIRNSRISNEQIKAKYFVKLNRDPPITPVPTPVTAPPTPAASPAWLCEEWKQCLDADKATLDAANPPVTSFSNSYMSLSGLTAEKGETVSCSAEDVLCETLKMSINSSQVAPSTSMEAVMQDARQNSTLKKRYSEYIDSNLTKRLRSDPNYSAERFPNSADKFHSGDA